MRSREIDQRVSSRIGREGVILDFQLHLRVSDPMRLDYVWHVWVDLPEYTHGRGCDGHIQFSSEEVDLMSSG